MTRLRVLVTAGSTQIPIDKVRSISNIFKGNTGWNIARSFSSPIKQAHVTLLASNNLHPLTESLHKLLLFRTYDELAELLEKETRSGSYDVIVHSAAVSDYRVEQVLDDKLLPINTAKKLSSQHQTMYLKLTPTVKLIDQIRDPWGFKGKLVKFKLEVGKSDEELIAIARQSRLASNADIIVANCLEWAREYAYIISENSVAKVARDVLPTELFRKLK